MTPLKKQFPSSPKVNIVAAGIRRKELPERKSLFLQYLFEDPIRILILTGYGSAVF